MTPKLRNSIGLCAFLIIPLLVLLLQDLPNRLSTDLLDLVPAESLESEEMLAMRAANLIIARQVFLHISGLENKEQLDAVAEWLDDYCRTREEFANVFLPGRPPFSADLITYFQKQKMELLFPAWLLRQKELYQEEDTDTPFLEWLAKSRAKYLDRFLDSPFAAQYGAQVSQDPLLILPDAAQVLGKRFEGESKDKEFDETVLAWLGVTLNPLDTQDQEKLSEAVLLLEADFQSAFPDLQLEDAGVYAVAQEAATTSEAEVTRLNLFTAIGVLVLLVFVMRRWQSLLLLLLPIISAVVWALVIGFCVFDKIHVFALGMSAVLLGLAVDYGIHAEMHRLEGAGKNAWLAVRKPLLAGCFSTCLGFLIMLETPILALRQVAVLVPSGLLAALACVYLIYSALDSPKTKPSRLLDYKLRKFPKTITIAFFICSAAVGSWVIVLRYSSLNNIERYQLNPGPKQIAFNKIISYLQSSDTGPRWVVFSNEPNELLSYLYDLSARGIATFPFEGVIVPSDRAGMDAEARKAFMQDFSDALEEEGFDAKAFSGFEGEFLGELNADDFNSAIEGLSMRLPGPMGLALGYRDGLFFSVFAAPEVVVENASLPVVRLAEKQQLNELLAKASQRLKWQYALGWIGITALLMIPFGLRDGLLVGILPVWAGVCGGAVQLLLTGHFTLMGWVGLILAYCLALDYSAFLVSNRGQSLVSIRLSGLTTLVAFGILTLSHIPALQALGIAVMSAIFFALLGIELLHATLQVSARPNG